MQKPEVLGAARLRQRPRGRAELSDAIDGHIAEIRRDLAMQMKGMRQLQEQADELRAMIREWTSQPQPTSDTRAK